MWGKREREKEGARGGGACLRPLCTPASEDEEEDQIQILIEISLPSTLHRGQSGGKWR